MENLNTELNERPTSYVPERKGNGFMLFLVFAVATLFVAATAIWFSLQSTVSQLQNDVKKEVGVRPTAVRTPPLQQNGGMKLQSLEGSVGRVGVPMKFVIFANSTGRDIVGFDALLDYNKGQFDFVSATANATGFKISSSTQNDILAITGYRALGEKKVAVFNNTQIATFTITPRQAGSFDIKLVGTQQKATSKLVDSAKKIMTPQLESAHVVISN